jgi:predicted TPR repeat methyltransferase
MLTDTAKILALLENNNLDQALVEAKQLASANPNNADIAHLLGLIYAKNNYFPAAIEQFDRAIKLDPNQAIFHNNISNAYKRIGNFDLAMRHLHAALRLAPNNAESYNNLGSMYYSQGEIKQAVTQYEKAIRLSPNIWEAHYNLANCYAKIDMLQKAISHYQTVLQLKPDHANAQLNLAMCLVGISDYAAALPNLELAAQANPQHAELQGHLADAYLNLGQTNNALEQYKLAIALDPIRPEWHHNLSVLYLRLGQHAKAKDSFKRTLTLQPDNKTAQYMLDALNTNLEVKAAPSEYIQSLFDQYSSYYTQHMTKVLHYNVPTLLRQAIGNLITNDTKPMMILDLGCGTGLCGIYFRDLAKFLVGVDLSNMMLNEAKALGAYDGLCCCNILQTIPGANLYYFDLIIAADVLVYIGDIDPLFALMNSALINGGHIAFTIENHNSDQDYLLQATGRYSHSQHYIEKIATKYSLKILTCQDITPRINDGNPIPGKLFLLAK